MLPASVSQAFAKASLAAAAARAAAVAVAAAAASPAAAVAVRAAAASLAAASSVSKGGKNAIFVGCQKRRAGLGKRILHSVRHLGPWCFAAGKCFAGVCQSKLSRSSSRSSRSGSSSGSCESSSSIAVRAAAAANSQLAALKKVGKMILLYDFRRDVPASGIVFWTRFVLQGHGVFLPASVSHAFAKASLAAAAVRLAAAAARAVAVAVAAAAASQQRQ